MKPIQAWTDYPIVKLGDAPDQLAPVRPCTVIRYDRDKYVTVICGGVTTSMKAGYVYRKPMRCGEGSALRRRTLMRLPA